MILAPGCFKLARSSLGVKGERVLEEHTLVNTGTTGWRVEYAALRLGSVRSLGGNAIHASLPL